MEPLLKEQLLSTGGPLEGKEIKEIKPVNGGCIHNSWLIELINGDKFFAKTTSINKSKLLEFELVGLKDLQTYANKSFLTIPNPLKVAKFQKSSILLMPWLNFSQGSESKLGKGLALLHKLSAERNPGKFGYEKDGYIGLNPQMRGWDENWGNFFVEFRLIPQFTFAQKWGLNVNDYQSILVKLKSFLQTHEALPSLVHGDLWRGNSSIDSEGKGIIFDPAVYWGDREVDIAMTKLFGGFSNDFYKSYEETWALPISAKERIEIYNLYHLLNHANMFGGSYIQESITSLDKISKLMNSY